MLKSLKKICSVSQEHYTFAMLSGDNIITLFLNSLVKSSLVFVLVNGSLLAATVNFFVPYIPYSRVSLGLWD